MKVEDPFTYDVIGAMMEVHRELGSGYLERIYQEALARELESRAIPFEREVELGVLYKGNLLNATYRADFICHGQVLVELKALDCLRAPEKAQAIHYLKATGLPIALLANFGEDSLVWRRFFNGWTAEGVRAIRGIPVQGDSVATQPQRVQPP